MAFINEIVSEEDIKKYKLDEIMREFSPFNWKSGRPVGFVHSWTIDRDRNVYFRPIKSIEDVGPSGRPETTNKKLCILNWQGSPIQTVLGLNSRSSQNFIDIPFRIIWDLIDIDLSQFVGTPEDKILSVLREALLIYGYRGANRQVPNTVVEFTF